jgi:hypothetical protein
MRAHKVSMAMVGLALVFSLTVPTMAAGKTQTLSGTVSDAMCGAKHQMPGQAADCTRACVQHGSKYTLVVGDKVYTLETSEKAALDKLNQFAGETAKVTGDVEGDTITVKAVDSSR